MVQRPGVTRTGRHYRSWGRNTGEVRAVRIQERGCLGGGEPVSGTREETVPGAIQKSLGNVFTWFRAEPEKGGQKGEGPARSQRDAVGA